MIVENMPKEEIWSMEREKNLITELIIMGSKQCSFSVVSTSEETKVTKKAPHLYSLPADLIQEIILYYTNNIEGLLFLRTISIEWKQLAESSLLWLYCPLSFYCPAKFLLPMRNHTIWSNFEVEQLKDYMIEDINAFVDGYEEIQAPIRLFQLLMDDHNVPPSGAVVCDAQQQRQLLNATYYQRVTHKDSIITRESDNISLRDEATGEIAEGKASEALASTRLPLFNRFEIAKEVSAWFLIIFRTFHTHWDHKVKKIERYYYLHDLFAQYFTEYFIPMCYLLTNVFFGLSIYGFTTLQRNVLSGDLRWENYCSFACIYFIGLIYLVLTVCYVIQEWLSRFRKDASLHPRIVYYDAICGYDMLIICCFAVLTIIGLLQAKSENLANDDNAEEEEKVDQTSFNWTITVVPIWGAVILSLLIMVYDLATYPLSGKRKKFMFTIFSTLVLVAGSLQLIASYYDRHFITTVGYAIIVLFPIILVLIVLGVSMVLYIGYYWFYQGLIFYMPMMKRCLLLGGGLIYVIAIVGMIFSIILLVFESFVGRNELPNTSTVGELSYLAVCMNAVVTIHLYFSSAKHRFTIEA